MFSIFGITKDVDNGDGNGYVITHYYHPVASLLYLILIGGIFLIIGTLILKKRDLS